uniref:Uncharacterized protein n=1 Tax=Cyclopterus lumpus TaxID=8103 RepID=A0A8C2WXF3_CYCLU
MLKTQHTCIRHCMRSSIIILNDCWIYTPRWRCTGRFFWPGAAVWSWTCGRAGRPRRNPSSRTVSP